MKKIIKSFLVVSILAICLFYCGNIKAADVSSKIKILDWDIFDKNNNAVSATNVAEYSNVGQTFKLKVSFSLNLGETVAIGDIATIPWPKNNISGTWYSKVSSEWENILDSSNKVVGRWKYSTQSITVEFIDNCSDITSSSNFTISTGSSTLIDATVRPGV